MSKNKKPISGIVYSTDPSFTPQSGEDEQQELLPAAKQRLIIRLDTKHRAGKAVTLVEGFTGPLNDLEDLGKKLKSFCGTGGSAKDGLIIVQGDNREKIMQWLIKNGYRDVKRN
jgi:translation initiation factor 1